METLGAMVRQVWSLMEKDFDFLGYDISLLDIYVTSAVIAMLIDLFLDYMRGDTEGAK